MPHASLGHSRCRLALARTCLLQQLHQYVLQCMCPMLQVRQRGRHGLCLRMYSWWPEHHCWHWIPQRSTPRSFDETNGVAHSIAQFGLQLAPQPHTLPHAHPSEATVPSAPRTAPVPAHPEGHRSPPSPHRPSARPRRRGLWCASSPPGAVEQVRVVTRRRHPATPSPPAPASSSLSSAASQAHPPTPRRNSTTPPPQPHSCTTACTGRW